MTTSDRKIMLVLGAIVVFLAVAAAVMAPATPEEDRLPFPSTYSASPGGALGTYLMLNDLGYGVERWESPPAKLPFDSEIPTLLVIAHPVGTPTDSEQVLLTEFVQRGNRILFCGANLAAFLAGKPDVTAVDGQPREFTPKFPSYLTRGVSKVQMRPEATWMKTTTAQSAIYGNGANAAVISWKLGKGEVIWWAGASPLTNTGLTRADNLQFFLNSVGAPGLYKILWDEHFHGQEGSIWGYARKAPVQWGLWQMGLIAVVVLITYSRRSGPIYQPAPVSRLSPLEFVETMGGLYQRANALSVAVTVAYKRLRLELTRRLGLSANVSDDLVTTAAATRLGIKREDLVNALREASVTQQLTKPGALAIVRQLARFSAKLRVPATPQEKS